MIIIYYFLDWDERTHQELNICGEEYDLLIDICFKYSKYFSFIFPYNEDLLKSFPFNWVRLRSCPTLGPNADLLISGTSTINKNFFKSIGALFDDSLFINSKWLPEDLCFYREDRTLFFWSVTHEGICIINERQDEEISSLCAKQGWEQEKTPSDNNNIWIPRNISSFHLPKDLIQDANMGDG